MMTALIRHNTYYIRSCSSETFYNHFVQIGFTEMTTIIITKNKRGKCRKEEEKTKTVVADLDFMDGCIFLSSSKFDAVYPAQASDMDCMTISIPLLF